MSRAAGFFCQRTVAKDRGRAQKVFGTDMLDFRRYLWHTREETGREGVRAHFPISGQKSFLWQPCLRAQQEFFAGEREGKLGNLRVEWIYIFYFHSILPFTIFRFWYLPLPLPHNVSDGPSLIGVVPSHYIEGVQIGEWRQTTTAKP